ncbi:MAG: hypothetical protein WC026_16155 [Hyphomicrobium sp.]|uniref:hypothetical protein n=1 Tax=Hyphomicrobium sp. TaxID=82 RepID=UPI003569C262
MKTIWNKQTGEPREYESVDAREILANSPELYTDKDPSGGADNSAAVVNHTVAEMGKHVAKGPRGLWFVHLNGERISSGFQTEEEAAAEMNKGEAEPSA